MCVSIHVNSFSAFCFSGKLKIKDKSNAYYSATNTTNICS